MSSNEKSHYLVSALQDHMDPTVSQVLLHGVVLQVPIAPIKLQRLIDYLHIKEERERIR